MIELKFLKVLILIRQVHQKGEIFVTIGILQKKVSYFNLVFNDCHHVLMMSINLNDIVILNIKGADYCCIINRISKSEVVNLLQNTDLSEKTGTL